MSEDIKDIIVVGGGPAGITAGITAGIYSARYMLDTMVISSDIEGQVAKSHKICNYTSHADISGMDLSQKMYEHIKSLDVPFLFDQVTKIKKKDGIFHLSTMSKTEYKAKKVIFTAGTKHKHLDIKGEKEFAGKGVSYCATCDAAFFKDKMVAVVGGGDAAVKAALLLSDFSRYVYIIYRREKFFRAEPAWVKLLKEAKNVKTLFNENITEIKGDNFVESVTLKSGREINVDGVFVEIGSEPKLEFIDSLLLDKDQNGYLKVNDANETNVEGFFAAGDVTDEVLKQIITAAAQGAKAAYGAYTELRREAS